MLFIYYIKILILLFDQITKLFFTLKLILPKFHGPPDHILVGFD